MTIQSKKCIRLLALLLLPVLFVMFSCKKRILDYRKAYKGKYAFHLHQVSDTLGQGSWDTTYHYQNEISLVNRDEILVGWYNGNKIQLIVTKKGELFMETKEIGAIDDDAIWLDYTIEQSGTPSVTTHYTLTGEQID